MKVIYVEISPFFTNAQTAVRETPKALGETKVRRLKIYLTNTKLYSGVDMLEAIYNTLMTEPLFLKLSDHKIIMVSAYTGESGNEMFVSLHGNTALTNDTTFTEYYDTVKDRIVNHYGEHYFDDVMPGILVTV
ncbi:MAG: hypothetical protein WDN66_03270 [Candidatus Saccharibacteria bacterium]